MKEMPWFDLPSLRPLCDKGAWQRGLALQRNGQVLGVSVGWLADGGWLVQGEVQGTQRYPYSVSIELKLQDDGEIEDFESDCTCPVGYQCKHGVAVLAEIAERADMAEHGGLQGTAGRQRGAASAVRAAVVATYQERMAEMERLQAQIRLQEWLQALDQAAGLALPGRHQGGAPADRPEQYLYLVSMVDGPQMPLRLQLQAAVSRTKVAGGWTKPKLVKAPPGKGQVVYEQASEADRQVLQLLRSAPSESSYYSAYAAPLCSVLEGALGLQTLELAASTGRLFVDAGGVSVGAPLQWGAPLALDWQWQEVPAPPGGESAWNLLPRLPVASATLCRNAPPLYVDTQRGLCGLVQCEGLAPAQLDVLLKAPPLPVSALQAQHAHLAQCLGPVPLPSILPDVPRLAGITPVARLHVAPTPAADVPELGLLTAQLRFDYQGCTGWWVAAPLSVLVDGPTGRVLLQRDGPAELDAIERLMDLGLLATEEGVFGIPGDQDQSDWLHWADNGFVVLRDAGFAVTLDSALEGWISHAEALDVQLLPQGGAGASALQDGGEDTDDATSPWFTLSLGMEINGQRHNILPLLPRLIATAAAYPPDPVTGLPTLPPYVYLRSLDSSGFVRLPTEVLRPWMAALLELVGERGHDFSGESLQLSRLDALRTSAALGEGAVWQGAAALRSMVQQLNGQGALPEVPVPASVQAQLRPYQQQGLNWLQFLRAHGLAGILADDMGLGKTLQTLAHIQVEKDAGRLTHPALIVAPVSLMGNWQREAARFCPQLRSLVLHGKERHAVADSMAEHDIVIAPYSLLQRDRERWLAAQWHLVVLDEAQNIKNASTHAAQVVGQLQANHRLCLSGTPMENHLGEIWSLFHFLMPGFLGSQKRFTEVFRTPIEKLGNSERLAQLRTRVTPFMLRRTKALVAHELPPKVETVMRAQLSGAQANLYETIRLGMEKTVREALANKGLAKSQITILDALLKLRQVCCDPRLVPLEAAKKVSTSAKLEQLMEVLPEMLAEGRRILLFSQFTSMLALIEAELKKRKLSWVKLTGQSQKRDAIIEQFTSGQVPLFLISLKAGGVGLNLPQADTVIHYDPWWNPAVEQQATDRAHRIGQTQSV
ncbi:MAG: SNF2-related protein, partial [Simplicispira sp.]|nr:SNF2-related protein [Simplicispira sp.]